MAKRGRPPKKNSPTESSSVDNSLGPSLFQRDEFGLLKNVQYSFTSSGAVDWRAMVQPEHLFPNKSWFESRGQDTPHSSEGLRDDQLLIKLSGIKELARLRGFTNVSYWTEKCDQDHVAVTCTVTFIPNYETQNQEVSFQDMANATLNNTHGFGQNYLEAMACNRAYVRCIRNFLNIHIVGADEVGKVTPPTTQNTTPSIKDALSPQAMIKNHFKDDFDSFISVLRDFWTGGIYKHSSVTEWNNFEEVPTKEARVLLKLIKDSC